MVAPLLGFLGRRAALALSKNKKAREALTKPVGQFLSRRAKLATGAKELKKEGLKSSKFSQKGPSPARKAARKNFAAGAVLGAGTGELARRTAQAREKSRIEKFNKDMEELKRKRRKEKITKPRKRKEILS
tara:strand:- start:60 stop:452 length:393 start_codon:yes stop_codon:yes gene_type:complete